MHEPALSKLMYMLHSVDSNRKLMVDSVTGPDKFITLITEWVTAYKSMGLNVAGLHTTELDTTMVGETSWSTGQNRITNSPFIAFSFLNQ